MPMSTHPWLMSVLFLMSLCLRAQLPDSLVASGYVLPTGASVAPGQIVRLFVQEVGAGFDRSRFRYLGTHPYHADGNLDPFEARQSRGSNLRRGSILELCRHDLRRRPDWPKRPASSMRILRRNHSSNSV
jgi:hypothetical protein